MEKVNNYWIDENNNKWDCDFYTEEQAQKESLTLSDCRDCSGCRYCRGCSDCSGCSSCSMCRDCRYCRGCSDCSGCSSCSGCSDCSGCSSCSGCRDCSGCSNCSDCRYCRGCRDCRDCSGCSDCSDCSDCSNCRDFKINPERITSSKIGSRKSNSTFYWTDESECIVCGCFKGNMQEFEDKIKEVHAGTEYEKEYLTWIEKIKVYRG